MNTNEEWQSSFEAQVRSAFDFLMNQFHFKWTDAHIHPPECWAAYENETTRVTIAFELGSGPRVELQQKRPVFALTSERYDLAFLLMERAPDENRRSSILDLDDPALPSELQRLAGLLEKYGSDVLTGDFAIFPRLRERARENLERTNRELYGQ